MKKVLLFILLFVSCGSPQTVYSVKAVGFGNPNGDVENIKECSWVITIKENSIKLYMDDDVFVWTAYGKAEQSTEKFSAPMGKMKAVDENGVPCEIFMQVTDDYDVVMVMSYSEGAFLYYCERVTIDKGFKFEGDEGDDLDEEDDDEYVDEGGE